MIRILIADDDLISRLLLTESLARFGTCDVAVDGNEAVRAYRLAIQRNRPYDLICLDVMMPNMDGIEALRKIRAIEKEQDLPQKQRVKVIMATALADELTQDNARSAECSDYITKPIDNKLLVQKLSDLNLI